MNRVIDDANVSRMRQGNHNKGCKKTTNTHHNSRGGGLKSFEFLQRDSEGERSLKIE